MPFAKYAGSQMLPVSRVICIPPLHCHNAPVAACLVPSQLQQSSHHAHQYQSQILPSCLEDAVQTLYLSTCTAWEASLVSASQEWMQMMCIDELPCLESGCSISCYGRVCTAHMRPCSGKQSELGPTLRMQPVTEDAAVTSHLR